MFLIQKPPCQLHRWCSPCPMFPLINLAFFYFVLSQMKVLAIQKFQLKQPTQTESLHVLINVTSCVKRLCKQDTIQNLNKLCLLWCECSQMLQVAPKISTTKKLSNCQTLWWTGETKLTMPMKNATGQPVATNWLSTDCENEFHHSELAQKPSVTQLNHQVHIKNSINPSEPVMILPKHMKNFKSEFWPVSHQVKLLLSHLPLFISPSIISLLTSSFQWSRWSINQPDSVKIQVPFLTNQDPNAHAISFPPLSGIKDIFKTVFTSTDSLLIKL